MSLLVHAAKAGLVLACFAVWLKIYLILNKWGAEPVRAIHLTRPCDVWPWVIQPWTAVLYIFPGYVMPFLPFLWSWPWPKLKVVLTSYGIASAIGFLSYWLVPLSIRRPEFEGTGLGDWLMRGVMSVDDDASCCPSFHVCYAILAALLVARGGAGPMVQAVVWIMAVVVCITTVTTGQHYLIDVAGGLVCALVAYYAALWIQTR